MTTTASLQTISALCSGSPPTEEIKSLITDTYKSQEITFFINGTKTVLNNPNPRWTLLDFIRAQPGLKGTKLGCGEGGCGACTVVLQVADKKFQKRRIKNLAVNACLFPLIGVDGKHVITVEGIGNVDKPHPLQERIAKLHGSQCGFCTPGIVMSLYALVRNAYDPETGEFRLSERDIELEGHLDGNLCRCTGYKPILNAARTFVTEDLKGHLVEECAMLPGDQDLGGGINHQISSRSCGSQEQICGRPGGCCREGPVLAGSPAAPDQPIDGATYAPPLKSKESSNGRTQIKTSTELEAPILSDREISRHFQKYSPDSELIFPPALWKYEYQPVCFGEDGKLWFRPTTLRQLLELKHAYPSAKLVSGATEVQIEVRFKSADYAVCVYVSDIEALTNAPIPIDETAETIRELVIAANTPLTEVESLCRKVHHNFGKRAVVLEALRNQLRYFAGRQIRNVASLAGNIITASPISDTNPVLMAAGTTLVVQSKSKGQFELPMDNFFVAYRTTALSPDAILTYLKIPLFEQGSRQILKAYKQAKRKGDDIAIVTAAFRVKLNNEDVVEEISLVYGGMAPTTEQATPAETALIGRKWFTYESLDVALTQIVKHFDLPFTVQGGMAHYRKTLALSLFVRFWHESAVELGLAGADSESIAEIQRAISTGTRDDYNPNEQRIVGKQFPHLSALKQCTGEAQYIDDMPKLDRELFGGLVLSSKAHAKLISVDWNPALQMAGVVGYIDRSSITKEQNVWGSIKKDEPFFAEDKVFFHGQVIGMVYAQSALEAQAAAKAVKVVYEELSPILTIDEAIESHSFPPHGKGLRKGMGIDNRMKDAFDQCYKIFEDTTRMGGQEHFYLETNAALVIPSGEDGQMEVWSSTQNTMETQEFVSQVTGVPSNRINARVRRMGGAFGGKESRSVPFACYLAIAAKKEKRPVRLMLTREEDMLLTGQRHPFQVRWKIGVSKDGKLIALEADVYNNAGFSQDLSGAVMDRCLTHMDNTYECPNVYLRGHVCRTNTHSNTAFRGFGAPQGMFFAETMMQTIADGLKIDVDELRRKNLYNVGDRTPFFQEIDNDWHVPTLLNQLSISANYESRKIAVAAFNAGNKWKKRGISLIPTKFGLSFATALHLNQAGASVKIYHDGSVLLHHGGTEMGQGLYTKMCQIAAQELGVPLDAVYTQDSSSYQVANASPTAASSGSDLNGMAVKDACDQLNERLKPYREKLGPDAPLRAIAHAAYIDRVNLSANGFWKMPRVGYTWGDTNLETVQPMYYYFTQGAACSEVELDLLTGDHTVIRTDIMMVRIELCVEL